MNRINKYCLKCTYCGVEAIHSVSNIEQYVRWQECKHCGYNKFVAKQIEIVDYYKDDPIPEAKIEEVKVQLEEAPWY